MHGNGRPATSKILQVTIRATITDATPGTIAALLLP
jgi:hypothetical protein